MTCQPNRCQTARELWLRVRINGNTFIIFVIDEDVVIDDVKTEVSGIQDGLYNTTAHASCNTEARG